MSSPIDVDSLSGLAAACLDLEQKLIVRPMTREGHEYLRVLINKLQVIAPNHKAIIAARVSWYEIGLDDFEERALVPLERGQLQLTNKRVFYEEIPAPPVLMRLETVEFFLKRGHLKDAFPRLYSRVVGIYQRIVAVDGLHEKQRNWARSELEQIQKRLLEGRL